MAISKIILNGVTQMYLTGDTVSDASHIRNGYVGHLNDGTSATGSYSGGSPSLQAKTNISPTTSSQTIQADSGYDGLSSVQINAMPTMTLPSSTSGTSSGTSKATITPGSSAQYLNIPTGYNGTAQYYTISATTSGGMNIQAYIGMETKANQAYEPTSLTLKVAKTGTYKISWDGCRSSTSGTNGSRLYINDTAQTAYTSFDSTNTRFQHIEMTGVSLTANDQVTVWCRARGTSYYMTVSNLIIEQTA